MGLVRGLSDASFSFSGPSNPRSCAASTDRVCAASVTSPGCILRRSVSRLWPVARDKIAHPVGSRFGGGRIAVGPAAPTGEGDAEGEVGGARGAGGRIAYGAVGGAAG